ncbi:MAG TPA: hypothetical protein DD730_09635 [Desulfosporosinus sp.]|jgi:hypothetical protein|nr:hypothetical protein [Desulfosporosinus sp.]
MNHMMLFCPYPLGTRLVVGVDASFWIGHFAGIQNGVAILRNAQLFANPGKPVDGIRPVVRIPIYKVNFVALDGPKEEKDDKDQK